MDVVRYPSEALAVCRAAELVLERNRVADRFTLAAALRAFEQAWERNHLRKPKP